MIALIGSAYGWEPPAGAVPGRPRRSYSQWEYAFATGERLDGTRQPAKDVNVYVAAPGFLAAQPVDQPSDVTDLQAVFVAGVVSSGKDFTPFGSCDALQIAVLRDVQRLPPSAVVAASHTVVVQANGKDALELTAPAFPKSLPQGTVREVNLLKAAYGVVSFEGRSALLEDCIDWCFDAREISGRTLVGVGGAGKTRFAYELYRHLRNTPDWDARFAYFALLRQLEPVPAGRRLRVLLLARTASWGQGWLASLRTGIRRGERRVR